MRDRSPKEWKRTGQAFLLLGVFIYALLLVLDAMTDIASVRMSGLEGGAVGFAVAGALLWVFGARKQMS